MITYWLQKAKIEMPDFTFCIYAETLSVSYKNRTKLYHKSILVDPFPILVIGSHFI